MTTTLFSSFVILCLLGVPIAFVLGLSSVFAFIYHGDYPFTLVVQRMFTALDGFSLMAIPFFIFAGGILDIGGISRRIVNFSFIFVGTVRGGLAMVGVIGSMIFAGVSGSAVADSGGSRMPTSTHGPSANSVPCLIGAVSSEVPAPEPPSRVPSWSAVILRATPSWFHPLTPPAWR